ncbi:hypothetical protein [Sphingomonas elodea]|uniref:hypothetical protein n=1 Tax=Sphingomonas elodea TaxID=179878 RepID=UPI0002DD7A6C|nr:hypothetical protein [Sphingomonas elodea]
MMSDARTITRAFFSDPPHPTWTGRAVGAVLALIGLVLAIGGAWLAVLGGSLYYLVTGVAMVGAGVLLVRGRTLGGWLYLAIVVLTFLWAWWEVGANAWAQVPRIIALVVLLVAVLAAMATMRVRRERWRFALAGVLAAVAITGVDLAVAANGQPDWVQAALPAPGTQGMADPSGQQTGADWPSYGGTGSARRCSPLAQMNASNVGSLKRAWLIHTGDMPSSPRIAGRLRA